MERVYTQLDGDPADATRFFLEQAEKAERRQEERRRKKEEKAANKANKSKNSQPK